MQGNPRTVELLNDVLTGELTAINQYFIHGKMCANWGYERLAERIVHESIDEMKHADQVIERILFFDADRLDQSTVASERGFGQREEALGDVAAPSSPWASVSAV